MVTIIKKSPRCIKVRKVSGRKWQTHSCPRRIIITENRRQRIVYASDAISISKRRWIKYPSFKADLRFKPILFLFSYHNKFSVVIKKLFSKGNVRQGGHALQGVFGEDLRPVRQVQIASEIRDHTPGRHAQAVFVSAGRVRIFV
jgi:hypothetical protein